MEEEVYTKIMGLYESHLQVKKLFSSQTIVLYLHNIDIFVRFCSKYQKQLALPENWGISEIGVRELEAFIKYQIKSKNWKRSTLVTCLSAIKSFLDYCVQSQYISRNSIKHFRLAREISEIGSQRFDIQQINRLFNCRVEASLMGYQQRLLLELIYGLGMSLKQIVKIKTAVPELDDGSVRLYFRNSRYQDYPFSKSALNVLKSYLKLIDSLDRHKGFWINENSNLLSTGQLQKIMNKLFILNDMPEINASELRDLSLLHFSQEGADVRSLQALRQFKQLRRLQSLNKNEFSNLHKSFKQKHLRSFNSKGEIQKELQQNS